MPFRIIRDDISRVRADAIVCSASPDPGIIGGGEAAIHRAAGPELMRARARFGKLEPGAAVATGAYGLPARYVIHTVGPIWSDGCSGEIETLRRCYRNAIAAAVSLNCQSAAFPLISSGHFGFTKSDALRVAIGEFQGFAAEDIELILVVYDSESYELSSGRFAGVAAYIDDNYIAAHPPRGNRIGAPQGDTSFRLRDLPDGAKQATAPEPETARRPAAPGPEAVEGATAPKPMAPGARRSIFGGLRRERAPEAPQAVRHESRRAEESTLGAPQPVPGLEERMRRLDAGFSETLLKLIDESGCTDAEIYKRANISRKLFSKIRSSADYRPSKPTALAFCVALHLSPEQARELIGRAGYALSHSSRFDVIMEYFLERGVYDIIEINETLFYFDQPLLGSA